MQWPHELTSPQSFVVVVHPNKEESMSTRGRNKRTWGVPRIKDPRFTGLTVRVTEVKKGGSLYLIWKRKGRLQKMRSLDRTRLDLGATEKEQRDAARTIG